MKIFDKAQWHVDAGENIENVIEKFRIIYTFLMQHHMLSDEGKEILIFGIDSAITLNQNMVTPSGSDFLDQYYNLFINVEPKMLRARLDQLFIEKNGCSK